MLPDYPVTKEKIRKWHKQQLKLARDQALGPLDMPTQIQFEGDGQEIIREDGTREGTKFTKVSAEIELDLSNYEELTVEDLAAKQHAAGAEIARQQAELMLAEFERAATSVGNNFDAGGQPMSVDLYFQALDAVEITFSEDGKPLLPKMIVGPALETRMTEITEEIRSSPEHQERFDQMVERKRREWLDREASRKLVG